MTAPAQLYRRANGFWGSSCDGTGDTGHHIVEAANRFTVYSVHDMQEDRAICTDAARAEAEAAIAADWRSA